MLRRFAIPTLAVVAALTGSPVPAHTQASNPCAATPTVAAPASAARAPKYGSLGNDSRDVRDLLHLSSAAASRARLRPEAVVRPTADRDENNIAILEDSGDLIIPPNAFDLAGSGLRFEPAGAGYAVARTNGEFRSTLGRAVTLGDDDSSPQAMAFAFDFFGRRVTSLFVNSDGNLTFDEADNASTERGIARLATGAPRIAPFFTDLDPSAGGRMFVDSGPEAWSVTWCAVPGFDSPATMTVQTTLFRGGAIEFRFGAPTLIDGIVALSPGRTEQFDAVDLSAGNASSTAAFGEQFTATASLDLATASRRFYASHPDSFDQLVFWTDTPVMSDAFAFQVPVKNAITGLGLPIFDFAAELGSAGALQSVLNMDRVGKYGESLTSRAFGGRSPLGILAHETGHRWLAHFEFLDANRQRSDALLGRQRAHWSFFVDSDGSVMEGNEIQDQGGGVFRTTQATEKYSRLDMYAMGLATAAEVPSWFYIDAVVSGPDREEGPAAGVSITGTRRDVLMQDVIDAMGPRVPAAADSPRVHRQAYIYVKRADTSALVSQQELRNLARIRDEFGPFFSRATENRMTVRTTLTP